MSFKPSRCRFSIETNQLVNESMIRIIIDKIKDERIKLLNELIKTINFRGFINPSYSVRKGIL
ncbi:MAG: hypothetical protein R6W84_00330, partial [Promethearchaeia archaeon]